MATGNKKTVAAELLCAHKAFAFTTGHMGIRKHDEVKEQALEALKQRSQDKKNVSLTLRHQSSDLSFDEGILSSVHKCIHLF